MFVDVEESLREDAWLWTWKAADTVKLSRTIGSFFKNSILKIVVKYVYLCLR